MSEKLLLNITAPFIAVLLSLVVGGLFILVVGENPLFIYSIMFKETFSTGYGIGQLLFKMTPLIFTGLSVAFAFKAGLFNIGAEGQLCVGAMAIAVVGYYFSPLDKAILVPLCLLSGFIAGALWASIPAALKSLLGVHEVINTIMMNFIAYGILNYFLVNFFNVPETVHTPELSINARLPRLSIIFPQLASSPANTSFFISILCLIIFWFIISRTKFGYEIRAVGYNPVAAGVAGINVKWIRFIALTLSGGISGLVGSNFVMGYKYYYEEGFSLGIGFMGIAVALLGRNDPIGIFLSSLLFGFFSYGGLVVNRYIPKELVDILQAIVIIFVVLLSAIFKEIIISIRKRKLGRWDKG